MTDIEMLTLAAKAAGIECDAKGPFTSVSRYDLYNGIHTVDIPWSPLTDDGDALRLAVKLKFDVLQRHGSAGVQSNDRKFDGYFWESFDGEDASQEAIQAAARRVIVRAAAEIGKATRTEGGAA